MPKLVITHAVVDLDRWLKGKEERVAVIGPCATNATDHVAMDGSILGDAERYDGTGGHLTGEVGNGVDRAAGGEG
jgi:hypothetical protein